MQHRHHDLVAAQAFGDSDDALDQRLAVEPRLWHVVEDTGDTRGQQVGKDKADVGPAAVDGRPADPGAARDLGQGHALDPVGQHARRRGVEDSGLDRRRRTLRIDIICNTVTHDASG